MLFIFTYSTCLFVIVLGSVRWDSWELDPPVPKANEHEALWRQFHLRTHLVLPAWLQSPLEPFLVHARGTKKDCHRQVDMAQWYRGGQLARCAVKPGKIFRMASRNSDGRQRWLALNIFPRLRPRARQGCGQVVHVDCQGRIKDKRRYRMAPSQSRRQDWRCLRCLRRQWLDGGHHIWDYWQDV